MFLVHVILEKMSNGQTKGQVKYRGSCPIFTTSVMLMVIQNSI